MYRHYPEGILDVGLGNEGPWADGIDDEHTMIQIFILDRRQRPVDEVIDGGFFRKTEVMYEAVFSRCLLGDQS